MMEMTPFRSTVFVVDDDADIRKALNRSLSRRGYVVESYPSAEEFLAGIESGCTGCLVLDVRMPGMNGLELQAELSEMDISLPIIFITGHGDIPMSVRAMKKGAYDFLEKPYPVENLVALIDKAVDENDSLLEQQIQRDFIRGNFDRLTARERDVMALLVAGAANATNKIIARELGIGHRTVDDHRSKIMAKMQARSLSELVEMAKCCEFNKPTQ
jgi:FixJ family two-component response regulator